MAEVSLEAALLLVLRQLRRARIPASVSGGPDASDQCRSMLARTVFLVVAEGEVDEKDARLWSDYWGLTDLPIEPRHLAAANRVAVVDVHRIRRRVDRLVRRKLSTESLQLVAQLARGKWLRRRPSEDAEYEAWLANIFAALVAHNLTSSATAVAAHDLRVRTGDSPTARRQAGVDRDRRRDERKTFERALGHGAVLEAPVRLFTHAGSRKSSPDFSLVEQSVENLEDLYWRRDGALRETLVQARNAARQGISRHLELILWDVQARVWREDEDIAAVHAASRIHALVGPHDHRAIQALADAAIVLQAHGFLRASLRYVDRATENLRRSEIPEEMKNHHSVALSSRRQAILCEVVSRGHGRVDLDRLREASRHNIRATRTLPGASSWAPIAFRRAVETDTILARVAARDRGGRATSYLRADTGSLARDASDLIAASGSEAWKIAWHMPLLDLALVQDDEAAFAWAAGAFRASMHADAFRYPNQFGRWHRIRSLAVVAQRGWTDHVPAFEPVASPSYDHGPESRPSR